MRKTKLSAIIAAITLSITLSIPVMTVSASSLDEVIEGTETSEVGDTTQGGGSTLDNNQSTESYDNGGSGVTTQQGMKNQEYINDLQGAQNLTGTSSSVSKIEQGIQKVASFIVQILFYAITAFLVVKVALDLCYILLPFTRTILANGYQGNGMAAQNNPMGQQGGMGMNGMGGMGGMNGMGGYGGMGGMGGYGGGYGSRYGGGMGMNGMGMNGMQGGMGMQGQQQPMGKVQFVSNAALNAVAAENVVGPNGGPVSPLKLYAKSMTVELVLAPVLFVLAISGALTNLGFLIGNIIASAISSIGGML